MQLYTPHLMGRYYERKYTFIKNVTAIQIFGLTIKVRTFRSCEKGKEILRKRIEYKFMISINKEEAKAIRDNLPNVHIARTMKQKSKRSHYFCDESRQAVEFLDNFRNRGCITEKVGGENRYRNKA